MPSMTDHVDRPSPDPRVLSVCTGYGGLDIAVDAVLGPLEPVAYLEIEAYACANLVHKMEAGLLAPAPIWTDVRTFDPRPFRGLVDWIVGGYPCQGESHAGLGRGANDPRWLWPHIVDAIESIRPDGVFFENVDGHLARGLAGVLGDLEFLGFGTACGLYTAAEVGGRHRRVRVFVVGITADSRLAGWADRFRNHGHAAGVDAPAQRTGDLPVAHPLREGQPRGRWADGEGRRWVVHGRFPSGPGEPQQQWEPPRTEPCLGRHPHGASKRVDRLRLAGNGVVPATAYRAFVDLTRHLLESKP